MPWSAVYDSLHSQVLHSFRTCAPSSKTRKSSADDLPPNADCLTRRQKTTGMTACSFQEVRYSVMMPTNSDVGEEFLPGPNPSREGHVTYGFGRRICIGKHLANNSLFMSTARILQVATLQCAQDENGEEMPLNPDAFVDKGVTMLVLFPVDQY